MAGDCPIGLDYFAVDVVYMCFWHRCVGVFFGHWCVCGGSFFVLEYLKCIGTSGFIFPVSNHSV